MHSFLAKNYPLQKDSTLQEIRWYQWENVVNRVGESIEGNSN